MRGLSAEHAELKLRTEALAAGPLRKLADVGEPGRINRPLLSALAANGLLDRIFQRTDRGYTPTSATDLCVIREGLARYCTEAETTFALQGLGAYPILLGGTPPVIEHWIPRIADGAVAVGFALTEPEAGSDAAALALAATPTEDGYLLNGEKVYISNAPEAEVYSVFARTTP
ncbi:MAG: acyl-CoA dehydrogenase family protein, partial [Actinomycetota bacterium]|nr:acyl-CoA dehydrogenase family protein [Actinomycetota bacterium]